MVSALARSDVFGTEMSRYGGFYMRSHLFDMFKEETGQIRHLDDYFRTFNDILREYYYYNKMSFDSGKCIETIRGFFIFFNTNLRRNITNKLSYNYLLDNEEKTGIKCLQLSIDIINLMIDQTEDPNIRTLLEDLFGYFSIFHHYSNSSGDARTITERILICLCKCCGRINLQDQLFDLIYINQINLEGSFIDLQSTEKIKVAVAIFICLCGTINKGLRDEARAYLRDHSENCDYDNLGIDKELIQAALYDEEQMKEKLKQWEADNVRLNEYLKQWNEDYVKQLNEHIEKTNKDIRRILNEDNLLQARKRSKKQNEISNKKLQVYIEKRNEDIRILNENHNKKLCEYIKKMEEDTELKKYVKKNEQFPIIQTKPNESNAKRDKENDELKVPIFHQKQKTLKRPYADIDAFMKYSDTKWNEVIIKKRKENDELKIQPSSTRISSYNWIFLDNKATIKRILQRDKRNLLDRINKSYSGLKEIFDQSNGQKTEDQDSFINIIRFFHFYNTSIRSNIIVKLRDNKSFEDVEKIGMNCLCVSINIINSNMDEIGEMVVGELFDYLKDFHQYSSKSAVARRMTESILYCLCNYCAWTNNHKNKRISLTEPNKNCLEKCFLESQSSNKIKLSAAIIISFLGSRDDQLNDDTRMYLKTISNDTVEKYLGIDIKLIREAVDTDRKISPEKYHSKTMKELIIINAKLRAENAKLREKINVN